MADQTVADFDGYAAGRRAGGAAQSVATTTPHPVDRHVGAQVARRRLSLKLTQSDLARALGLTFQQIQKYERGANRISASKLWDIARFLDVEIGSFFAGIETGLDRTALDRLAVPDDAPATRNTIEISRRVTALSTRQQRLILRLVEMLLGTGEAEPSASVDRPAGRRRRLRSSGPKSKAI